MNPAPKLQPAFFGGLVIGVLSALPIISVGNCCCCLWVVAGGIVAAWIMQANHPSAITIADGAVVGLLAGLVGAFVMLLLSIPISITLGPIQERFIERLLESSTDLPPATEAKCSRTRAADRVRWASLITFVFQLVVGSIFATVGGILGTLLFRKGPAAGSTPPPLPCAVRGLPAVGRFPAAGRIRSRRPAPDHPPPRGGGAGLGTAPFRSPY